MCVKGSLEFSVVGEEEYNGKHVGVLWTMDRQGGRRRGGGGGDRGDHHHHHHQETDTFSKSIRTVGLDRDSRTSYIFASKT